MALISLDIGRLRARQPAPRQGVDQRHQRPRDAGKPGNAFVAQRLRPRLSLARMPHRAAVANVHQRDRHERDRIGHRSGRVAVRHQFHQPSPMQIPKRSAANSCYRVSCRRATNAASHWEELMSSIVRTGLAAALFFAGLSHAVAQTFPSKQIDLIVPFVAGGTTDSVSRADRAAHERQLGPACDRSQPAGRRQHDRHQHRRQGRARRSHAAGHHHRLRDQRQPAEDAIRPDQGFRADHRAHFDPDHAGGAPVAAGEKRQGIDRVFQGAARRCRLRVVGRRHVHPPGGRDVQQPDRRRSWCTCRSRATPRCSTRCSAAM